MPTVPTVTGPTVEPERLRPQYRSTDTPVGTFGGTIAAGLDNVAESLTHFSGAVQHAQDVADEGRVNSELATFQIERTAITDEGLQRAGKDAIGATPDTVQKITDAAQARARNLSNDRQRSAFIQSATGMIATSRSSLLRHENGESTKFVTDAAVARKAAAVNSASKYWTQPEEIEMALGESQAAVEILAKKNGWSKEATDAAQEEAKSDVLSAVLSAMTDTGHHAAFMKYYQDHEPELSAQARDKFSKTYQTTSDVATVFKATDDIYNKHTVFDKQGRLVTQNINAMYAEANTAPDAIRKDVVDEVSRRITQTQKADDDYKVNITQSAWDAFERGGGNVASIPMTLRSELSRVNGQVLEQMKTDERQRAGGGPEPFDFEAYGKYESQLPSERLKTKQTAMDMLLGKVPRGVLKEKMDEETIIRDQQLGLRPSGAEIKGPSLDRQGISGVISTAILANGDLFETPETVSERNTLRGKFAARVQLEASTFRDKNKRNPDYEETQAIVDKALIERVREIPWGFDKKVRAFEEPLPTEPTVAVPTIPSAERASIVDRLRAGGYATSEDNIQKQYAHDHASRP